MASKINRSNRALVKGMTLDQLRELAAKLEPQIRQATSLLECAKNEMRRRTPLKRKVKEGNNEESS